MTERQNAEIVQPTDFDAPTAVPAQAGLRWRWQYAVYATLAALVLAFLLFLLNSRALLVTTNAQNPDIDLSGGVLLPLGGNRFLVLNGEYRIHIDAQGYEPLEQSLQVDADTASQLDFQLKPLPGRLRVRFAMDEPVKGVVRIDGTGMGPASELLFRDLDAGEYQLRADAYLYAPEEMQVQVRGRELTEELEIALEPNWGFIEVRVQPGEAKIYAGNQLLDSSESPLRIEAGTSELRIAAPGYKDWTREVQVAKGDTLELGEVQLAPVDSEIEIQTRPAGVSVTLNGEYMGQTPLTLDLAPEQQHQLQLFKAGFQRQTHQLQVERDAREIRSYQLTPDMVEVNLSVSPAEANVYIDDQRIGAGSQQLELTAVKHRIRVEAEGYATQAVDFLPVRGSRQLLQVHLLTEEQAAWADIPSEYTGEAGHRMKLFRDPGEVPMGSSRREPGRRANEAQWTAVLKRPFFVSLTETTNAQYRLFASEHSSGHFQSMGLDGPDRPAVGMSWQQAALFCNWLSEKSGLDPFYTTTEGFVSGVNAESTGYRLLTEAEWAFLAKMTPAGTVKKYSWGNQEQFDSPPENFADSSISDHINFTLENVDDGYPVSAPVGSFPPNARGVYDMGGNVLEWVHDWYQPLPYDTDEPQVDPLGPEIGEFHVIRGASWARGYLPQLRVAYRDYDAKGRNDLGFRIARYAK